MKTEASSRAKGEKNGKTKIERGARLRWTLCTARKPKRSSCETTDITHSHKQRKDACHEMSRLHFPSKYPIDVKSGVPNAVTKP